MFKPEFILNDKVDWYALSRNPNAIYILEKNLDKVNWTNLCLNPNAIHILEKNLDKVKWDSLSENPNAIHILENNLDKVNWYWLSSNPNAIHMLEKNILMLYYGKKTNAKQKATKKNRYDKKKERRRLRSMCEFLSTRGKQNDRRRLWTLC
jgi:hypothetical protein